MLGVVYIQQSYYLISIIIWVHRIEIFFFSLQNDVQLANTTMRKRIFVALAVMDRTNLEKAPSRAWPAQEDKPLEPLRLYLRLSVETIVLQVNLPLKYRVTTLLKYLKLAETKFSDD